MLTSPTNEKCRQGQEASRRSLRVLVGVVTLVATLLPTVASATTSAPMPGDADLTVAVRTATTADNALRTGNGALAKPAAPQPAPAVTAAAIDEVALALEVDTSLNSLIAATPSLDDEPSSSPEDSSTEDGDEVVPTSGAVEELRHDHFADTERPSHDHAEHSHEAATPVTNFVAPTGTLEERGQDALRLISYDWRNRLPGWTISFLPGQGSLRGLTYSSTLRIEIYVSPDQSAADLARIIAHELGHAVDIALNNTVTRLAWMDARGIALTTPWWPGYATADFDTGAGDFAECFATWLVGSSSHSSVAGPCTPDQLALVATMAS